MILWMRNILLIVLILSVVYAVLSLTGRYKARKRLQAEYKASNLSSDKDVFIATGLTQYDRSMRPKLFLFVFILPIAIFSALLYLAHI